MNFPKTFRLPSFAVLSGGAILWGMPLTAEAQEALRLRVIESVEVDLGPRSITYHRVEAPTLKPQPVPVSAPPTQENMLPSAGELAAMRAWEAKTNVFLFLSCTVFGDKMTEVRWWREDGEYVLWSGIDFNYLRSLFDFETDVTRYSIFLGIGDEPAEAFRDWNAETNLRGLSADFKRPFPILPVLASSPPEYRIVSHPKTGIAPEAKAAFDAIHHYFQANRERLVREFETAEEARMAHEAWLRANPPLPKDTTVSFFPIQSGASAPTSAQKTQ